MMKKSSGYCDFSELMFGENQYYDNDEGISELSIN